MRYPRSQWLPWLLCLVAWAGCSDPETPIKATQARDSGTQGDEAGTELDDAGTARQRAADGGTGPWRTPSPVELENRQPGTDDYALQQPASAHQIEGYASSSSAAPGRSAQLFVNVDKAQGVRWDLYRIGDYQGHGARLVASGKRTMVAPQPSCPVDPQTGLVECAWTASFTVAFDARWLSGYYLVKLTSDAGLQAHVPIILREDTPRAPLLVQASVATWQAYNLWGGTSLYKNQLSHSIYGGGRARRVSFDRPYASVSLFMNEGKLVRWLESQGADVAYTTNVDVDEQPDMLVHRKLFMTVGHDEYWSVGERDAVEAARAAGVSLAFLSANTAYWRVRLEPSSTGVPRRIVTCYKSATLDPHAQAADTTALFRDPPQPRPENALIGIMYGNWSVFPGFPFVVRGASHWLYQGTGVRDGDTLGNIVFLEWDTVTDNGQTPAGLEVIGDSPVIADDGTSPAHQNASVYYPTASSFVFAAGSIGWVSGVSPDATDPRAERVMQNLLARVGQPLGHLTTTSPTPPTDVGAGGTSSVLAGDGQRGYRDGAAARARFDSPSGVAEGPAGELYVADTGNALVRKIDQGQVSTFAGCAPGPSSAGPCFVEPIGLAADSGGNVYVSDAHDNKIYKVSPTGQIQLLAGTGTAGAHNDPNALRATFNSPRGLALDTAGRLYVADGGSRAVRTIDATGVGNAVVGVDGLTGVAVGPDGTLYFTSYGSKALGVVVNRSAQTLVAHTAPSAGLSPITLLPMEGLVAEAGSVLFSDTGHGRVRAVTLSASHTLTTVLGDGRAGTAIGSGATTNLGLPRGLARFGQGFAVADCANHRIVEFAR
ncbi:MAG TPA: N,N-dimethylformamidase beta subunit family domain-containing protein [Polyangiales bacterium]